MQIGFYAESTPDNELTKAEVLASLKKQGEKAKKKFKKICDEHQFCIGQEASGKYLHAAAPIKDTTSADIVDLALKLAEEQLAHLSDDSTEQCSVSFNITIHRPSPKPAGVK